MSCLLESLGFQRADWGEFSHTAIEAQWNTFSRCPFNGEWRTVAIDQRGDIWIAPRCSIDLRPHGFRTYSGNPFRRLFDGLRKLGWDFWKVLSRDVSACMILVFVTIVLFFTDSLWFLLTPKRIRKRWEE